MAKKAYFIGIAGKAMGPLAKAFKDADWKVTGSDQEKVYPPISTYLKENMISYTTGYSAINIPHDADLIIVGRSALMIDPKNQEYFEAKKVGCPVLSYPEVLQQYLVKKNSIVVAGTYGKTTISAIVTWILINAGINPSYMTGGVPMDMEDGVKITSSEYSVIEGDEPPALFETDLPKFMFYKPKYLVITATKHDHPEIYKTEESYLTAFVNLIKLLPVDGMLVYNLDNTKRESIDNFKGKKISYSSENEKADYFVKNIFTNNNITQFTVSGKKEVALETILIGKHNLENICGAVGLCLELRIDQRFIKKAIKSFRGIKTRLEFLGEKGGRFLYWDLAQHPAKVKGTLDALREHYGYKKIICVFDPSSTGLKYKESLLWYPYNFDHADQVIVGKVSFLKKISSTERVTGREIIESIAKTQKNVIYEPMDEKIVKYLIENTKTDDVIVFMSSGGLRFTNLIEEVKEKLSG